MKNYIQEGKVVKHTVAGAAVVSGQALKVGSVFGVCVTSGAIGDEIGMDTEGVFELDKDASVVTGLGHLIYWDDVAKKATITATANTKIGYATEAAVTGAAKVKVRLVPNV